MKRPMKLKVEISCEVMPDGSLGCVAVSSSAPRRSGYILDNPFESPAFQFARQIIEASFKKQADKADGMAKMQGYGE